MGQRKTLVEKTLRQCVGGNIEILRFYPCVVVDRCDERHAPVSASSDPFFSYVGPVTADQHRQVWVNLTGFVLETAPCLVNVCIIHPSPVDRGLTDLASRFCYFVLAREIFAQVQAALVE